MFHHTSFVGGVPAKVIKRRFDDKTIEQLLQIQWWNYGPDILKGLDITQPAGILNELKERKDKLNEEGISFKSTEFIFDSDNNTIRRKNKDGSEMLLYDFAKQRK